MPYPVNTILTRRVPNPDDSAYDEVRVVGSEHTGLSVAPNADFGPVRPLDAATARTEYVTDAEPDPVLLRAPGYTQSAPSPEEVFAEEQRKTPPPVDTGREALRRQVATNAQNDADTGTTVGPTTPTVPPVSTEAVAETPGPEPTPEEVASE